MKKKPGHLLKKAVRKIWALLIILVCISIAQVLLFRVINPPFTPLMFIRLIQREGMRHTWKPLQRISSHLQQAVLAAEDQRFPVHNGFDFQQIGEALKEYNGNKPLRGASTISMQVARNLFLWPGRSWIRKVLEAYYTILVELLWGKQRILEMYLNIAEWGPGIFGAEAAANGYFGCPASALDRQQAALLAAVLPNPRKWSPLKPTVSVLKRKAFILKHMDRFTPLGD